MPLEPNEQDPDEPFTDGRPHWDWKSRYDWSAWLQIIIEGVILIALLFVGLYAFAITISVPLSPGDDNPRLWLGITGLPADTPVWVAVALGGLCGGCANSLKWLYHGVAHGKWHRDRIVWRIIVPLLSGTLALFTALMIGSGLIPIFSRTVFDNWKVGVAFGFFVGFFSDNLVASLQRLAAQALGTLERQKGKD